jgi:hypothetical protein
MSLDINALLDKANKSAVNRWELDNVVWNERTTDPQTLINFLNRISELATEDNPSEADTQELSILCELADSMDQTACEELIDQLTDADSTKQRFIERLARQSALETLCTQQLSIETMEQMCKLSPDDFIMVSKRGQDIINSIRELVIQGETLSSDVAGA